jgi:hypothetical protein
MKLAALPAYLLVSTCLIMWLGAAPALCSLAIFFVLIGFRQGMRPEVKGVEPEVGAVIEDVEGGEPGTKLIAGSVRDENGNEVAI